MLSDPANARMARNFQGGEAREETVREGPGPLRDPPLHQEVRWQHGGHQVWRKCHGQPGKDIKPATMEILRERYPEDKASGFAMYDLRGAWKITFNRTK